MPSILVIENNATDSAHLEGAFLQSGHEIKVIDHTDLAWELLKSQHFDLIITQDLTLVHELRGSSFKGHVLMLSGLTSTQDIIRGLDAGADDYVTKPFDVHEVLARVRALLRRKNSEATRLKNAGLEMDLVGRQVQRDGKKIELTTREFCLLEFFMRNQGTVIDRSSIARAVWGLDFDPDSNVIDVYVNHLRKKIDSPFSLKLLRTVVGQGYLLKKAD